MLLRKTVEVLAVVVAIGLAVSSTIYAVDRFAFDDMDEIEEREQENYHFQE